MVEGFQTPPIRFAYSGRTRLAHQVFGDGPNVVAIPPMAQHIEMAWEWPDIRSMLTQFGSFSRYLHFDKRSTGASDRKSRVPGLDERVEDLRALMDAAGMDHAHFFACSEGGPMAILFASAGHLPPCRRGGAGSATGPLGVGGRPLRAWCRGRAIGGPPTSLKVFVRVVRILDPCRQMRYLQHNDP